MNRAFRFLMGVGVVAILVPAVVLATSGPPSHESTPPAAVGNETPIPVAAEEITRSTVVAQVIICRSADCEPVETTLTSKPRAEQALAAHSHEPVTLPTEASDTTAAPDPSTPPTESKGDPASSDDHSSHEDHGSTKPNESTKPTTAPKTTPTTSKPASAAPAVSGSITGSACPCEVKGTVELKGNVNLKGDITVVGGTLVARPGVNVQGNGFQILFTNGGRADFQGSKTSTWSGDGSNANLSRDITFNNMRRIMFHGGGASTLKYFSINDSGTSALGDYPLHFHLNGNSTRGTVVEGVVVKNGRNHAFVPHGSHGITFKDTIASGVVKEAYWWDPPGTNGATADNSNDIVYEHALAVNVDYPRSISPCCASHHTASAFLLGVGSGNAVRNSAARNTRGGADCSGYHWPEFANGKPNTWVFKNNAAYGNSCHGIFVWQNDSGKHVIDGFTADRINHGAYVNKYVYNDVNVRELILHATGRDGGEIRFNGGRIDDVRLVDHSLDHGGPVVFTGTKIKRVIKNDAGGEPGKFIFNGTGLTCAAVSGKSPSVIVIDGTQCP